MKNEQNINSAMEQNQRSKILMNETNLSTSTCRHCRFYDPEGRRGGSCQMLGVPVQSSWKACSLAASPFRSPVKQLEDILKLDSVLLDPSTQLEEKTPQVKDKENSSLVTFSQ